MRYTGDSFQYRHEVEDAQNDIQVQRQIFFNNQKHVARMILKQIKANKWGMAMHMLRIRDIEVCSWEIPLVQEEIEDILGINE